jgi:hypothetical protein
VRRAPRTSTVTSLRATAILRNSALAQTLRPFSERVVFLRTFTAARTTHTTRTTCATRATRGTHTTREELAVRDHTTTVATDNSGLERLANNVNDGEPARQRRVPRFESMRAHQVQAAPAR